MNDQHTDVSSTAISVRTSSQTHFPSERELRAAGLSEGSRTYGNFEADLGSIGSEDPKASEISDETWLGLTKKVELNFHYTQGDGNFRGRTYPYKGAHGKTERIDAWASCWRGEEAASSEKLELRMTFFTDVHYTMRFRFDGPKLANDNPPTTFRFHRLSDKDDQDSPPEYYFNFIEAALMTDQNVERPTVSWMEPDLLLSYVALVWKIMGNALQEIDVPHEVNKQRALS